MTYDEYLRIDYVESESRFQMRRYHYVVDFTTRDIDSEFRENKTIIISNSKPLSYEALLDAIFDIFEKRYNLSKYEETEIDDLKCSKCYVRGD